MSRVRLTKVSQNYTLELKLQIYWGMVITICPYELTLDFVCLRKKVKIVKCTNDITSSLVRGGGEQHLQDVQDTLLKDLHGLNDLILTILG